MRTMRLRRLLPGGRLPLLSSALPWMTARKSPPYLQRSTAGPRSGRTPPSVLLRARLRNRPHRLSAGRLTITMMIPVAKRVSAIRDREESIACCANNCVQLSNHVSRGSRRAWQSSRATWRALMRLDSFPTDNHPRYVAKHEQRRIGREAIG